MKPSDAPVDEPREGRGVRAGAVLGGVLVVLAVGVLAWRAWDAPTGAERIAVVPLHAASPRAVRAPWPHAVPAEPVAAPASAPVIVPPGHLDVCGIGVVKESEWRAPARVEVERRSVEGLRERVAAELAARGDESSRAVALAVLALGWNEPAPDMSCRTPDCPEARENAAAMEASWMRRNAATQGSRDQLARLAAGTRDPEVYAWAYGLCSMHGRDDADSHCRMLSAEQWARLDPDNGVPWLAVADAAKQRRDTAAVTEALHRVSVATSMQTDFLRLSTRVVEQLSDKHPPQESFGLVAQVVGMQFAMVLPYAVASSECSVSAVRDANRLQQCAALAENLWSRGTSAMDRAMALAIGKRVGWPAERWQTGREELDALMRSGMLLGGEQPLSCDAITRQTQYFQRLSQGGEIDALREHMRASGRTLDHWLREGRKMREASMRSADAAPSVPLVR